MNSEGGISLATKKTTKTAAASKEKKAYKVSKKRSGRFAVQHAQSGKYINGAEKVAVLVKEGLIKAPGPGKKEKEAKTAAAPAAEGAAPTT